MKLLRPGIGVAALAVGALYGFSVAQYQVFPFELLQHAKREVRGERFPAPSGAQLHADRLAVLRAFQPERPLVMVGDSLTAAGEWGAMFPNAQPVNRGVPGETIADVIQRLDTITALRPQRVFLLIGTNDLLRGDEPAAIFARYTQLVTAISDAGAEVVIQSTLPCARGANQNWADINRRAAALNSMLLPFSREHRLKFVDLWPALTDRSALRDKFTIDGVHLNAAGYVTWRDALLPVVEEPGRLPRPSF